MFGKVISLSRFIAGWWYVFAVIIIASYTANLAAFLTVETMVEPIKEVEDLVGQQEIQYGMGKGGSTSKFFANSEIEAYQKLNQYMTGVDRDEVLMESNAAGADRVEKMEGKFAFFMESSSIDYIVERKCNLSKVGLPLDSKGYGIVLKKGSPFKALLDAKILRMQEDGTLHRLKTKWWKQKRGIGKFSGLTFLHFVSVITTSLGGGACSGKQGRRSKRLGLDNMAGIFLVSLMTIVICRMTDVEDILGHFCWFCHGCYLCHRRVSLWHKAFWW